MMATPMSRVHYLLSYLIWRMILLPVEVVIPMAFGALAFGVPIRGSLDRHRARLRCWARCASAPSASWSAAARRRSKRSPAS